MDRYEHDRRASFQHSRRSSLDRRRSPTPPPSRRESAFSRRDSDTYHEPPAPLHPTIISTVHDILHSVAVSSGRPIPREDIPKYLQLPLSRTHKWTILREKEEKEDDRDEYFRLTCLVEGLWQWYKPGDVEKLERAMQAGGIQLTVKGADG